MDFLCRDEAASRHVWFHTRQAIPVFCAVEAQWAGTGRLRRRSPADRHAQLKGDPMSGAWIVATVIAALILLLLAKVAGVPITVYSVAAPLVVGGAIVIALHVYRK
jgi:hypothetical protein